MRFALVLSCLLGIALVLPALAFGLEEPAPPTPIDPPAVVVPLPPQEPDVKFPLPRPSEIGADKFTQLLNAFIRQGKWSAWKQDLKPRFTGPFYLRNNGQI